MGTDANLNDILERIIDQAKSENIRITQHAHQEMAEDNFTMGEVLHAIINGEILENYPEHRRGSCLLLHGQAPNGRNMHIVCTSSHPSLIIITVYEPKEPKWATPKQRRKQK